MELNWRGVLESETEVGYYNARAEADFLYHPAADLTARYDVTYLCG